MATAELNRRIVERGREFYQLIRSQTPALFDRKQWVGRVLDYTMRNEDFRVRMFRFVDVFPALGSGEALTRHLHEYFGDAEDIPGLFKWGARASRRGGAIGGAVLGRIIRRNIREMARQFIIGETAEEAVKQPAPTARAGICLRRRCSRRGDRRRERSRAVCRHLSAIAGGFATAAMDSPRRRDGPRLGNGAADQCLGQADRLLLAGQGAGFRRVGGRHPGAAAAGVRKNDRRRRLSLHRHGDAGREGHHPGGIQTPAPGISRLPAPRGGSAVVPERHRRRPGRSSRLGAGEGLPISVRLVKGAYWDYETVRAQQNGWPAPVHTVKAATDAAFERQAKLILENHAICHLACGSHNIRSIAAVLETAESLRVPEERYEFQVLYGMAEPVRKALLQLARRVRLYCPYGEMVPGMAYLVRRLLENTANESFLRQSFAEGAELERLLEDPAARLGGQPLPRSAPAPVAGDLPPFRNEPAVDFTRADQRQAFPAAIEQVRRQLGRTWPLFIAGEEVPTADRRPSVNPAAPEEIVGYVCQAGTEEVAQAIQAAKNAFPAWRDCYAAPRAPTICCGRRRRRGNVIFELSAWQILEIGKQWDQAYADVAEAIDFLEYYARETHPSRHSAAARQRPRRGKPLFLRAERGGGGHRSLEFSAGDQLRHGRRGHRRRQLRRLQAFGADADHRPPPGRAVRGGRPAVRGIQLHSREQPDHRRFSGRTSGYRRHRLYRVDGGGTAHR